MSEFETVLRGALVNSDTNIIKKLTLLAGANKAEWIVNVIEVHIQQSPPKLQLYALYLIDSIIKNISGRFVDIFGYKIDIIFCDVFKKADVDSRRKMHTLRLGWKGIFTETKLLALDKKIKELDRAWPIKANVELAQLEQLHAKRRYLELQLATLEAFPDDKRIKLDSVDAAIMLEKDDKLKSSTISTANTIPFNFAFNSLNANNIFGNDEDGDAEVCNDKDNDTVDNKNEHNGVNDGTPKQTPTKSSEGALSNENNEDDDDVIEVRTKRVIVEIIDNDEEEEGQWVETSLNDDEVIEAKAEPISVDDKDEERSSSSASSSDTPTSAARRKVSPSCVTSSTNEYVDGHWVNNSTIDVNKLLENAAKIKVEPREADHDDDDDCFEYIGEIFPYEAPGADGTTHETRCQETTASCQQRKTSPGTSEVVTMDGEIIYGPVDRRKYDEFKIHSNTIQAIPSGSRPKEPGRLIPPKVVRPKADETSGLCTIM